MNASMSCEATVFKLASIATIQSKIIVVALISLSSFSGLVAVIGNTLIIVAVFKTLTLQTPSFKLIVSLCFCDLATGIMCHPVFIVSMVSFLSSNSAVYCAIYELSMIPTIVFIWVSLLTVTAISVDRLLALRLKQNYKIRVTNKRTNILVIVTWTLAIFFTLISGIFFESTFVRTFLAAFFFSCLIVTMASYFICFEMLKRHCSAARIQPASERGQLGQPGITSQGSPSFDVIKYRKVLHTMLLVLALVLIFYIPLFIVLVNLFLFRTSYSISSHILAYVCFTLYGFSPALNPVIFIIKMKVIRRACRNLFKKNEAPTE